MKIPHRTAAVIAEYDPYIPLTELVGKVDHMMKLKPEDLLVFINRYSSSQ